MNAISFRRAQLSAAYYFLAPGIGYGLFTARLPALAEQTGATDADIGLALLAVGLGSLAMLVMSAKIVRAIGNGAALKICAVWLGASVVLEGFAASPATLIAGAVLFGFGMGLCQGSPESIPVVKNDFIFSAICEELGGIFAICLILVCMSFFLMIVNIALRIKNPFYKLIALGLGTEYAFQVFLTIGGATKFIPMTGVTLPLVSYGGSSVMSTILMLAIIQGLYILREDEDEEFERRRKEAVQRIREREAARRSEEI